MKISTERIYEDTRRSDGNRILVDRLWPRGISKEKARLDYWWKDIAPSTELRKWFHQTPEWNEFVKRYTEELHHNQDKVRELLNEVDTRKPLVLLYTVKDAKQNHAVVLKQFLDKIKV